MRCKSALQVNWGQRSFVFPSSDGDCSEKQRDAKVEEEEREATGSNKLGRVMCHLTISEGKSVYAVYKWTHLWLSKRFAL